MRLGAALRCRAEWHVLGKGSVGSLWAASLQRAGHGVTLLARPRGGLPQEVELEVWPGWSTADGEALPQPWRARVAMEPTHSIDGAAAPPGAGQPIKNLLVCTKAGDAVEACRLVAPRLGSGAVIVLLQNGIGIAEAVAADPAVAAVSPRLVIGSNTNGSYQNGLRVVHAGRGQTLLGRWASTGGLLEEKEEEDSVVDAAIESLAAATMLDVQACGPDEIERRVWEKLAVNIALNPLTALTRCRNGKVLESTESGQISREMIRQLTQEVAAVMAACCPHLLASPSSSPSSASEQGSAFERFALHVAAQTSSNFSSMYQDTETVGSATEIEFMNGYLHRKGLEHAVPTPTVTMFCAPATACLCPALHRTGHVAALFADLASCDHRRNDQVPGTTRGLMRERTQTRGTCSGP